MKSDTDILWDRARDLMDVRKSLKTQSMKELSLGNLGKAKCLWITSTQITYQIDEIVYQVTPVPVVVPPTPRKPRVLGRLYREFDYAKQQLAQYRDILTEKEVEKETKRLEKFKQFLTKKYEDDPQPTEHENAIMDNMRKFK